MFRFFRLLLRLSIGIGPLFVALGLGSIFIAEGVIVSSYMRTFLLPRSTIWGTGTATTKHGRTNSVKKMRNSCSQLHFLKNSDHYFLTTDSSTKYSLMPSPFVRESIDKASCLVEIRKTITRQYRSSTTKKKMKKEDGVQTYTKSEGHTLKVKEDVNSEPKKSPPPSFKASFFDSVDERMEELRQQRNEEKDTSSYYLPANKYPENVGGSLLTKTWNPDSIFDQAAFESYKKTMQEVISSDRFRRKKKQEDIDVIARYLFNDEQVVPIDLPTLFQQTNVVDPSDKAELSKHAFENELNAQREKFMIATNFTIKQHQHLTVALSCLAEICAKKSLPHLSIAWHKVKEIGAVPKANTMNTYLYVVSVINSDYIVSTSSYDEISGELLPSFSANESLNGNLIGEVATFHDILFEPTEKSITLRIKNKVEQGDLVGAEALLHVPIESKDESLLKLRTFFPILKGYCDVGDCSSALRLFKEMKNSPGVILEPETHVLVIGTLAEHRFFEHDACPIDGARNIGYDADSGPALFDLIAQEMADDVLEITPASVRKLSNAFTSSGTNNDDDNPMRTNNSDGDFGIDQLLSALPSLKDISLNNEVAMDDELVLSRVEIHNKTALCPRTGATLRLIKLEEEQKREFHDGLLRLATEQHQLFVSNNNFHSEADAEDYAAKNLMNFTNWLDSREGDPFTAIVDGANVAYFAQNFEFGRFNYHQIKFLVDTLEEMNEKVLVTVPHKYTNRSYRSNTGARTQRSYFSKSEIQIMNDLTNTGRLYKVPARCLDDYYWMLASVSNQTVARKERDLTVPAVAHSDDESDDHEQRRWPGLRPMLLSNDKMRDHKMELLAPRLFRRWTSSHIVNYNFTAFVDNECVEKRITFSAPDFFSREIQGNPAESGMTAWHFPVSDWDPNERFCIRLPRRKDSD